MLSEALAMDAEGMIHKEDVERQRNHLLNIQYNVDMVDISNRLMFLILAGAAALTESAQGTTLLSDNQSIRSREM